MATIGQPLTAPEAGWRRYDDTDSSIAYIGTFERQPSGSAYNGSHVQNRGNNLEIRFDFVGTKLRIIGLIYASSGYDCLISIDNGPFETIDVPPVSSNNAFQRLVYEKINLPNQKHTVVIKNKNTTDWYNLDAIDIDDNGYLTRSIGTQLTTPEAGWKRYDDASPSFMFSGNWTVESNASHFGGGSKYSNDTNGKISFKFKGTKIRIIGPIASNKSTAVPIKIDGTTETFNQVNSTVQHQTLLYEKNGLSDAEHIVEISVPLDIGANNVQFDAIDIDDTGRLLHIEEVTDPKDLQTGKRIRFNYKAVSGSIGTIANLGKETGNFIPTNSTTAPDGDAYFIMVDSDFKNRKLLIADRNIQNSISWDKLNISGITSGLSYIITSSNIIPVMTSNTAPNGIASASNRDAVSTDAWKAFDGSPSTYWYAGNMYPDEEQWLSYEFSSPKNIVKYAITSNSVSTNRKYDPKDWVFEALENDGVSWIQLDVRTDVVFGTSERKEFSFVNPRSYTKYRIRVTKIADGRIGLPIIAELEMMEAIPSLAKYNFTLRLPTGGINSTDKDNEWDKYILNSTLNGAITAGDNLVWNFSGQWSHTSTTNTGSTSTYRTVRSSGSSLIQTNETIAVNTGFRPVLLIEFLPSTKYFIKDIEGAKKYNFTTNSWEVVTTGYPTEDDYKNNGMDSWMHVDIGSLTPPVEVLFWTDDPNKSTASSAIITGVPIIYYKYKVELEEPYTLLKDWSPSLNYDIVESLTIPSSYFTTAKNPYKIKITVEQTDNHKSEEIGTILLYDTEPILMPPSVEGLTVHIVIDDNEYNKVKYNVSLNGKQIYPTSGMTPFLSPPIITTLTLNQEDILIGQQNIVEIVAIDEYGLESRNSYTFIGDYTGILFMDSDGKYFSNHIGEILQYLDFGAIIAGKTTLPKKVRVINKNGFPIINLSLTVDNSGLTNKSRVEMSTTEEPFTPSTSIKIPHQLNYQDEISLYVRIVTDKDAKPHSGIFEIIANADPV